MAMTPGSVVLLAATALSAALFLQGCENGVPEFVYSQCEAALEPTLASAASNGLMQVQQKCGQQYRAASQMNMCISSGQNTLELSKKRVIPKYVQQCSKFVLQTVCVKGADCYQKHSKITAAQSATAMIRYLQGNQAAIVAAMKNDLASKINQIISTKYGEQFKNRAVPNVISGQCQWQIQQRLGAPDIINSGQTNVMAAPTEALYEQCSGYKRSASWVETCQDKGLKKMYATKQSMESEFAKACGKSVLDQACQIGSLCAIDTSLANTQNTGLFAKTYLDLHYSQWFNDLKTKLLGDANQAAKGRLLAQPPTSRLFGVFEVPTKHVKTGLFVWAGSAAVIAGAGLLMVAVVAGRILRKRFTRSVETQPASEEELLAA